MALSPESVTVAKKESHKFIFKTIIQFLTDTGGFTVMKRDHRNIPVICGLILSVALAACSGTPPSAEPRIATTDRSDYTCVDGCSKPEWVDTIPADANGQHFFVGLSGYHATEQTAREEALINARKEYAAYTGVEVTSLDEVVRASFGLASEVVDATVSGRSHEKQSTDASVSRFKGQKYHPLRFNVSRYGQAVGSAFQYCVLATVPVDEIERVRQWKKEKDALTSISQSQQREEFQIALQHFAQTLKEGDAVRALGHWRSASELADNDTDKSIVQAALHRWGQALTIDVGRFGTICVAANGKSCILPVWLYCQGKPVAQLHLRLRNAQGDTIARTVTATNGRGEFLIPHDLSGTLWVELDPEAGLPLVVSQVNLVQADDFSTLLQSAAMNLFGGPQGEPLPVSSVSLGPITCQRGPAAGEFALAINGELRQILTSIPGLKLRDPQPRSAVAISQAVTRGIALSGKPTLSAGSPAIQAGLDDAEAALDIDYLLQGSNVVLSLSLVRAYNDEVLRTAQVTIPVTHLPLGISPRPDVSVALAAPVAGSLRLDITSHLGAGQVYREGEIIRYFFSSDRDCYLLLLYQDAGGQLIQIFPNAQSRENKVRSGAFIEFPRQSDPFEFVVTPPFGTERVYAFAATRPFATLPGEDLGGLRLLNDPIEKIQAKFRDFGRTAGVDYGEATTTTVTVRK